MFYVSVNKKLNEYKLKIHIFYYFVDIMSKKWANLQFSINISKANMIAYLTTFINKKNLIDTSESVCK